LTVGDHGHTLAYCGDTIVQIYLPRGHIHNIMVFMPKALAARESEHSEQSKQTGKT